MRIGIGDPPRRLPDRSVPLMAADTAPSVAAAQAARPFVLALDLGSSSVRGSLYDVKGRVVDGSGVQVAYSWDVEADGSVRLPHTALLELVARALDELVGVIGRLADDVVAAGVSCFLHSIAGLDAGGRVVTPVLSWADTTSAADAAQLRAELDRDAVHALTGAPLHAGYWPARIRRLRHEDRAIRAWTGFPELLAEMLTGSRVVSRSMASGTGLLGRAAGAWWGGIGDRLDVSLAALPVIVADDEVIGRLAGAAAARWPQLAHVDWFAAWGDGACGNVGLGAGRPGSAALMVGTSGALRSLVADPARPIPTGLFAQRLGDVAVVGGQLSEGGGMLEWTSRLLGCSQADLEDGAQGLDPDGHGLTVLPYAFGERGLGYHDSARATISGLGAETQAPAVYRAVIEAIAFSFADVDDLLGGVVGRLPDVVASGGALSHSPLLVQVLADSLGRAISVAPAAESSRRGAALLALHGSGLLQDVSSLPPPRTTTIPNDPERTVRYGLARSRRDALYTAVLG